MGGNRLLVAAAVATCAVAFGVSCESEEPSRQPTVPRTVPEFFEALRTGTHEDGKVFHAKVKIRARMDGVDIDWAETEGWLSEDGTRARAEWRKGPGNDTDIPAHTIEIDTPEGVYAANLYGDDDPTFRLPAEDEMCLPLVAERALILVACGFVGFGGVPDTELSVEPSTFDGKPTISLVGKYPHHSPLGSEEFPRGGLTPNPVLTTSKYGEYRFHLDAKTFRPVAVVVSLDADPDRKVFGGEERFDSEFIDEASMADDWFEPGSVGYVPATEAERRLLEDPKLEAAVYWLGRTFDPGGGLPKLGELYVNSYEPGRPRSGAPNIQLGLAYRSAQGLVRLDIYPPGDWEAFKARLGGNFPWSWCSDSRSFAAGAAKVTILAGYESFPYKEEFGSVTTIIPLTPGQPPPTAIPITPTVPPPKTEPCPGTPLDRFMAEVRFADATVVINGVLGYGGQDGRPWGVFDTAEALEAVARGLRLRQAGE